MGEVAGLARLLEQQTRELVRLGVGLEVALHEDVVGGGGADRGPDEVRVAVPEEVHADAAEHVEFDRSVEHLDERAVAGARAHVGRHEIAPAVLAGHLEELLELDLVSVAHGAAHVGDGLLCLAHLGDDRIDRLADGGAVAQALADGGRVRIGAVRGGVGRGRGLGGGHGWQSVRAIGSSLAAVRGAVRPRLARTAG